MARATGTVYAEVFGDKHLMATMLSWAARASNAAPAYAAMHEYVLEVEQELFESEGASGAHGAWNDRKETRKPDDGHPLLQASGRLMESLTDKGHPEHQFVMTHTGFVMGTSVPYAEAHQTGTEFMEPRRVIDLTMANRQTLVEILHLFITRAGLSPMGGGFFTRTRGGKGRFIG